MVLSDSILDAVNSVAAPSIYAIQIFQQLYSLGGEKGPTNALLLCVNVLVVLLEGGDMLALANSPSVHDICRLCTSLSRAKIVVVGTASTLRRFQ